VSAPRLFLILVVLGSVSIAVLLRVSAARVRRVSAELAQIQEHLRDQDRRIDQLLKSQGLSLAATNGLRQELHALKDVPTPMGEKVAKPTNLDHDMMESKPIDPATEARIEQGRTFVDRVLANGRWTDDDRLELRERLAAVPQADGQELKRRLVSAMNAGTINIRTSGYPF
jgi:hypothetical protein